jgi:multidrug transporter EmrE-like cation transporter
MAWGCLILAGCLEVVWSTALKLSEGFSRLG